MSFKDCCLRIGLSPNEVTLVGILQQMMEMTTTVMIRNDYLAARCTDKGPLSGVDPHVRRQLLRLSERFTTDLKYTAKRAYSLLQSNCLVEI